MPETSVMMKCAKCQVLWRSRAVLFAKEGPVDCEGCGTKTVVHTLIGGPWLAKVIDGVDYVIHGDKRVLIIGEIANMRGHYAVMDSDGKTHFGLHLDRFKILWGDDL